MKPNELKDYWDKISKEAGIDPTVAAPLSTFFSDANHSKLFLDKFVPKSVYTSDLQKSKESVDTLQTQYQTAVENLKKWDEWAKQTAIPFAQREEERANRLQAVVATYENLYGKIDEDGVKKVSADVSDGKSKTPDPDLMSIVDARSNLGLEFSTVLAQATVDHAQFGKPFNAFEFKDKAEAAATESIRSGKNFNIRDFYNSYVAPDRAALDAKNRQAEIDSEVARLREEDKQKASTQLPIDTAPKEWEARIDIRPDAPREPVSTRSLMQDFTKSWNEAGTQQ